LHSAEKDEYVELSKNFLEEKINAEDFSILFMTIYEGYQKKTLPKFMMLAGKGSF
jgi:hypothetical protein